MAGALKELRDRIATVQATQKITSAMRMVAASKLRQARERVEQGRWHQKFLNQLLGRFVMNLESVEHPPLIVVGRNGMKTVSGEANFHPLYQNDDLHHSQQKRGMLILISGDRGLCGSYNARLLAAARAWIQDYKHVGGDFQIVCIGRKVTDVLRREYGSYIVAEYSQSELMAKGAGYEMQQVVGDVFKLYAAEGFETADIVYTKFINILQSQVITQPLIPLIRCVKQDTIKDKQVYEFEPTLDELLPSFVPDYLNLCLTDAFTESIVSEQAARMTAMENATRNAEEMVSKLRLQYNQTRQGAITRELIEIISGAEAL